MATSAADWIAAYAQALGSSAPSEDEIEVLLELAGVAAHASERVAAPISCYLVGRSGVDPATACDAAKAVAAEFGVAT